MKMGIVGVNGMLGSCLALLAEKAGHTVLGYDLPAVDVTRYDSTRVMDPSCDVVVNCAAYTDVDGAESCRDLAFAVNDDGAANIARWCSATNTHLVHLSTDYVFDGELGRAYSEEDEVCPVSIYGESKLAGEIDVLDMHPDALIVRTQALFGPGGRSFPAAIIGRIEGGERKLRVVNDQTVSPTCTGHLADAIMELISVRAGHLVHVSSSGQCTWFEFACEIVSRLGCRVEVEPVSSGEFMRPARRPAFSVLDKTKFERLTGHAMPHWKDALDWYLGVRGS